MDYVKKENILKFFFSYLHIEFIGIIFLILYLESIQQ